MSLSYVLAYTQDEQVTDGTISDNTVYGGANPDRNEVANVLLVSKNDKNGSRDYLSILNSDVLNTILWNITNEVDGYYQATLMSFGIWNGSDAYVAGATPSVVYNSGSDTFYYCIQANTNISPTSGGGASYWTPITDFTLFQTGYTNITVTDYSFLIEGRTDLDIANAFYKVLKDDFGCNLTLQEAEEPLNLIAMLEGAQSKMLDDKGNQAEEIMLAIQSCTA